MEILHSLKDLQTWRESLPSDASCGFIPTMGALHDGHISLLKESIKDNDYSIISIFVNPTQFNNKEDLAKYPRVIEDDIKLLDNKGCDAIFLPTEETMYPKGETSLKFDFKGLENQMEGAFRPGHFDGVGTIVLKFLELIKPSKAYFGEKDYQQLRIIQTLIEDENLKVEIVPVPIARSIDGLALSSRNARLSEKGRKEALLLIKSLKTINNLRNYHTVEETITIIKDLFKESSLDLEYISIVDEQTLLPIDTWDSSENKRAFIAAYIEGVRLIDNIKLD